MDLIAKHQTEDIPRMLTYTHNVFVPILELKRGEIENTEKKTFKYGSLDRHQLDVYYPPDPPSSGNVPVLFFIYGGGFVSGARVLPPPFNLIYASLGAFFSQRGFLTIIPDYRLVPEVRYPEPAQDVRDAVTWVIQNADAVASADVKPNCDELFLMGHSAGASHVATVVLDSEVLSSALVPFLPRLKGVIFSAGPYHFENPENDLMGDVLALYYGTPAQVRKREPLSLLQDASAEIIENLPDILLVEAERDTHRLKVVGKQFKEALEKRLGKTFDKIIGKGHNHISPNVALGSGQGEEWGEEVVQWVRARSTAT